MTMDPLVESGARALAARLLAEARAHGVGRATAARTALAVLVVEHARSLDYDPERSAVFGRAADHLMRLIDRAAGLPGAGQRAVEAQDLAAPLVVPRAARARWEARPSLSPVCVQRTGPGRRLSREDKEVQASIWALGDSRRAIEAAEARIRSSVAELRAAGVSWTVIGQQLAITRQAAMKRYAGDALL